jgi:hypothetical protein
MHQTYTCFYCNHTYHKNEEHVFPKGLGGQTLYMDCVCEQCNKYFSTLEGELYKKSPIALMRSTAGVDSYNRRNIAPAPFKAPILLTQDEHFGIVYEVGQYERMQTFIRTQIILFQGQFYLEGNSLEKPAALFSALKKWLKGETLFSGYSDGQLSVLKYSLTDGKYVMSVGNIDGKLNAGIKFMSLPADHHLLNALTPRLYMDDESKLRVRAGSFKAAAEFLKDLLNHTLTSPNFESFKGSDNTRNIINVGFSFDGLKFDQALIKIALNCLLYYFPATKTDSTLKPLVSYVMTGSPGTGAAWDQKHMIFDSQESCHNISFGQVGGNTHIRISLFNGQFAYGFWINGLRLSSSPKYSRLLIDYKKRINTFQDYNAFLSSFPRSGSISEIN